MRSVFFISMAFITVLSSCSEEDGVTEEVFYYNGEYYAVALDDAENPIEDRTFKYIDSVLKSPSTSVFTTGKSNIKYLYETREELDEICDSVLGPAKTAEAVSGARYWVTAWEHSDYRGEELWTVSSRPRLGEYGWNDRISSFRIYASYDACVYIFHEHANYGGKSWGVNPRERGTYDGVEYYMAQDHNLKDNKMKGALWWTKYWNDNISSIEYYR